MRYVSTRGGMKPSTFSDVVIEGLAPDGGLTLPESYPRLDERELRQLWGKSYLDLAVEIIGRFAGDIPRDRLVKLVGKTYTDKAFGHKDITPVRELWKGTHLQDLSGGPTRAFKDVALQFLGGLAEDILEERDSFINFLGATSGDTGSSAEEGVRGKRRMAMFMMSPLGKMSPFQAAQMYSIRDARIHNLAVRSVFDSCQDLVKAVSEDLEFKSRHHIGSVNSINWGRVAAQVVYYFKGYDAVAGKAGGEVDFAVPTGNFGDIYAGWVARQMGLPIGRLILATNENDVLDVFFRTGVYRVRDNKEVVQTSSPSMDISKASNFERLLYEVGGRQPEVTRIQMDELKSKGVLDLRGTLYFERIRNSGIVSGTSTHQDRLNMIRRAYEDCGVVIDPHTADGVRVGIPYRREGVPLVFLSTARPIKFEGTIREALGFVPPRSSGFSGLEERPQRFQVMEAGDIGFLKEYIEEHAITG